MKRYLLLSIAAAITYSSLMSMQETNTDAPGTSNPRKVTVEYKLQSLEIIDPSFMKPEKKIWLQEAFGSSLNQMVVAKILLKCNKDFVAEDYKVRYNNSCELPTTIPLALLKRGDQRGNFKVHLFPNSAAPLTALYAFKSGHRGNFQETVHYYSNKLQKDSQFSAEELKKLTYPSASHNK
jgi:hypothetical protein